MHKYTVELRIYGKDLDISSVTEDLGLGPSTTQVAGTRLGQSKPFQESMWGFDGHPETFTDDKSRNWKSLGDGLTFLLERLRPVKDKIEEYKTRYKIILWCGHFQSSFDGGPVLSPALLKALGDFGVELFLDTYFYDDED
jgi:hypothetical protein